MKNFSPLILLIFLLSVNACKTSQTENNEQKTENSTIKNQESQISPVLQFSPQNYVLPESINYFPIEGPYLITNFRPIGWSENGMFAYIIEPADEACDCYFFKLHIQNLKTDKVEWSFDIEEQNENGVMNIDSVWKANDSLFTTKLNEFKIIQTKRFHLQTSNINNKGKTYYYNFKKETKFDDQYQIDWISSSKLDLTEQDNQEKSVFSYKETAYEYVLNTGLSGYLHSPYEDRIAFIIWQARWGYEGTPYVVNFKIIGTKLP